MGDYFGCMAAKRTSDRYFVVLGLGANLGASDRLENLRRAAAMLEERGAIAIVGRSSVFETPPAGGPPQPNYLNAAIGGTTRLPPEALLTETLAVERALGRLRPDALRWGPRTIDIDILWSDAGAFTSAALVIPHPRLVERAFALQPLLEIAPDAADPGGLRYAGLPAARERLRRVASL
jgi:2-amino-4-hydroxy-6-hydroxymethyldihydropteridine diphosphokinase